MRTAKRSRSGRRFFRHAGHGLLHKVIFLLFFPHSANECEWGGPLDGRGGEGNMSSIYRRSHPSRRRRHQQQQQQQQSRRMSGARGNRARCFYTKLTYVRHRTSVKTVFGDPDKERERREESEERGKQFRNAILAAVVGVVVVDAAQNTRNRLLYRQQQPQQYHFIRIIKPRPVPAAPVLAVCVMWLAKGQRQTHRLATAGKRMCTALELFSINSLANAKCQQQQQQQWMMDHHYVRCDGGQR